MVEIHEMKTPAQGLLIGHMNLMPVSSRAPRNPQKALKLERSQSRRVSKVKVSPNKWWKLSVGWWSVKIKTPWYGVSAPKTLCCSLSCDWLTRKKLRLNPKANWGALASDKANQTTTYQYSQGRSKKALCKFTQEPDGCKQTADLSRTWHGLLPKIYFTREWHLALALPLMTFKILSWLFFFLPVMIRMTKINQHGGQRSIFTSICKL